MKLCIQLIILSERFFACVACNWANDLCFSYITTPLAVNTCYLSIFFISLSIDQTPCYIFEFISHSISSHNTVIRIFICINTCQILQEQCQSHQSSVVIFKRIGIIFFTFMRFDPSHAHNSLITAPPSESLVQELPIEIVNYV